MKTIGIVIPTPGRRSLGRTLTSIAYQKDYVEDVLVVGDGHSEATKELCEWFAETANLPVRYQATVKTRDWGHSQVNYGLLHVKGDYVTYQDDDDIYLPRALDEMARLATELPTPRPIIGRVKTPELGILWQRPNATTVLDGHCLVAPNDKKRLGWMSFHHHGDQCLLHTTLRNYKEWAWADRVWTLTRPHWKLQCWQQVNLGDHHWHWLFYANRQTAPICSLALDKDPDSDRMFASLNFRGTDMTREELLEVAEFAVYACQGNDCWFRFENADDAMLVGVLREAKYAEHTTTEYTHDWPPNFWPPVPEFSDIYSESGERISDWRDTWGGRPVA